MRLPHTKVMAEQDDSVQPLRLRLLFCYKYDLGLINIYSVSILALKESGKEGTTVNKGLNHKQRGKPMGAQVARTQRKAC